MPQPEAGMLAKCATCFSNRESGQHRLRRVLPQRTSPATGREFAEFRDHRGASDQGNKFTLVGTAPSLQSSTALARAVHDAFRRGTFAPFLRASESPIAMACLRLFTLPPLPALPDRKVPFFRRRMALATVFLDAAPYLRRDELFFLGAMVPPLKATNVGQSVSRIDQQAGNDRAGSRLPERAVRSQPFSFGGKSLNILSTALSSPFSFLSGLFDRVLLAVPRHTRRLSLESYISRTRVPTR